MQPVSLRRWIRLAGLLMLVGPALFADEAATARSRGREMLKDVRLQLKLRYYSAERLAGLEPVLAAAEERLASVASEGQAMGLLAQALMRLRDSHTFLIPPPRPYDVEYGFELRMIGDHCRVMKVVAGSDAQAQGLEPGTAVAAVEETPIGRASFNEIQYALQVARPRPELKLGLEAVDGARRSLVVKARVEPRRRTIDIEEWFDEVMARNRRKDEPLWRYGSAGAGVMVARVSSFYAVPETFDDLMRKVGGAKGLIFDLRGNPGGSEEALRLLLGALFAEERALATVRTLKGDKPLRTTRPGPKRLYEGPVVALVDSGSASASELFARALQLEGRGKVLGDRSAGAVMLSEHVGLATGNRLRFVPYALSVTIADLIMKDGNSLEGTGVTPDEIILPSGVELRDGHDPVLARAAQLLGVELSPEKAGALARALRTK